MTVVRVRAPASAQGWARLRRMSVTNKGNHLHLRVRADNTPDNAGSQLVHPTQFAAKMVSPLGC